MTQIHAYELPYYVPEVTCYATSISLLTGTYCPVHLGRAVHKVGVFWMFLSV